MADVKAFVQATFPHSSVLEEFGAHVSCKVPKEDVPALGAIFSALEASKAGLQIEEYSFSQTTLEQVFISFARRQYGS